MSASDNLSTEAFRAVLGTGKLQQPVGQYWSTDHNEPWAYMYSGVYGEKPPAGPHLIVTANVDPKDDMPEAWSDARKPLVLKPGSNIEVTSVQKIRKDREGKERYRTRNYKPPRKMQA